MALLSLGAVSSLAYSGDICYQDAGPNPLACKVNPPAMPWYRSCIYAEPVNQVVLSVTLASTGWDNKTGVLATCTQDFGTLMQDEGGVYYCSALFGLTTVSTTTMGWVASGNVCGGGGPQ